ncbi:hypothetical protein tpqmel_0371 [Candidatus Gastranaerophilus sp. (ex Termes propinquus)]|nr:hypothetical protein tpqmel_0371 [Candidatus Gastranaerophilus sp. (ex Termes propinquus)]
MCALCKKKPNKTPKIRLPIMFTHKDGKKTGKCECFSIEIFARYLKSDPTPPPKNTASIFSIENILTQT